ncbi:hypothetical protein CYY_009348 [Polysphondylium violaceum]|uniref:EamA domain-containing protein n=1 Tax=Polysphondylium violaceum TaxID=133409 RepID=A0A8J4PLV3_9MYCE|nr:hypothetical protein CYY_009348 [Polysphondylium violaceum]
MIENDINDYEDIPIIRLKDGDHPPQSKPGVLKRFLSIFLVISIAVLMALISELGQSLLFTYPKPFMFNFFNTLYLILSFPIELAMLYHDLKKKKEKISKDGYRYINSNDDDEDREKIPLSLWEYYKQQFHIVITIDSQGKQVEKGISLKKTMIISIFMSVFLVGSTYLMMRALPLCEVSLSSVLFQSATLFVFVLSILLLKEKITIWKTIPVVLFMAGVVGITLAESGSKGLAQNYPHQTLGIVLNIVTAICWAFYEVLTAKFFGEANRTVMNTYLSMAGLFNLIAGIPILVILNYTDIEPFEIPDSKTIGLIILIGFIGFAMAYLIAWGLALTSPLYIRSGELMSIPFTLVADITIRHQPFPLTAIPGYFCIVVGFIFSIWVENKSKNATPHQQPIEKKDKEIQDNSRNI